MERWKFGQYLEQLLEQKGGRKAGWNQSRLAEKSKLSNPFIGWLINGETSGKKGTPSISLDTLISLSTALNVSESKLIAAYKGMDPDSVDSVKHDSQVAIQQSIGILLKTLTKDAINAMLQSIDPKIMMDALIAHDGPEKVKALMAEARRRNAEEKAQHADRHIQSEGD